MEADGADVSSAYSAVGLCVWRVASSAKSHACQHALCWRCICVQSAPNRLVTSFEAYEEDSLARTLSVWMASEANCY